MKRKLFSKMFCNMCKRERIGTCVEVTVQVVNTYTKQINLCRQCLLELKISDRFHVGYGHWPEVVAIPSKTRRIQRRLYLATPEGQAAIEARRIQKAADQYERDTGFRCPIRRTRGR